MTARGIDPQTRHGRSISRHDLVLASIPLAFLAMGLVSVVFDVRFETAMLSASLIGLFAMVDGMVLRPPNGHGG
ncbi:hypothetical protein [Natronosalvus vescus]|uniref:hypothetical protein n=1 Tax=Natronosalvus vescus TaxID=2953881 RepID=UPI00209146E0|nr:hypothetical protein [Natronosalvus vescus]